MEREAELRKELDLAPQRRAQPSGDASEALLLVAYERRSPRTKTSPRYPRSGYSDNALWQAAVLSADAFWQFGDTRDRAAALRLFARLKAGVSDQLAHSSGSPATSIGLERRRIRATSDGQATLKAIRREDSARCGPRSPSSSSTKRCSTKNGSTNPARVFVDLRNTRTVEALKDATIAFADDVVRQARIGRQPDNRTRIVFDLQGAGRHSVYSLYNPYRVVIDFERLRTAVEGHGATAPIAHRAVAADRLPAPPSPGPARHAGSAPRRPPRPRPMRAADISLSRQLGPGRVARRH